MSAAVTLDAIAGLRAKATLVPGTREELAHLLGGAHARGEAVAIVGGATEIELGAAPVRLDTIVRTTSLDRIVEYAPDDLVVTVEAGVTLETLQATLAPKRQRLALDPPQPSRATIGGLVATNAFGPLRARFGTLRDAVVGISLVRGNGVVVRGGGKVVKNVAGFDLPKLAIGSLGTLAAIATVTLRLHPLPEATRRLRLRLPSATLVRDFVEAMTAAQLEPAALDAERAASGGYELDVLFEGFERGVDEQLARARKLADDMKLPASEIDAAPPENEAVPVRSRDAAIRSFGTVRIRLSFPPSTLPRIDAGAIEPLMRALAPARASVYPGAGCAFLSGEPPESDEALAALEAAVADAREKLAPFGGSAVVAAMPDAYRRILSPWGPPPPSFALMRRLKERFDPANMLNPGRFVGGI